MLALAVFIACGTVFGIWRDALPLLTRLVVLAERWFQVEGSEDDTIAQPSGAHVLPPDIESLAQAESEEWARESVRERARELFRSMQDWDQVQQVLHAERQMTLFGTPIDTGTN